MNTGAFVGGVLGLVGGVIFLAMSIYTQASRIDPPPIIAIFFAFVGGLIGQVVNRAVVARRNKKASKRE